MPGVDDVRSNYLITALLFDFDGVIVDTEVPTFQSWRDTYAEYGVDLALNDWLPAVGSGSSTSGAFDAVAHLERLTAELYRQALAVLELQANQALAFEDSPSGVRAAKRAQVVCAAVPNEITRGAAFDEADVVLSSFAEQSLDEILRLAGGG